MTRQNSERQCNILDVRIEWQTVQTLIKLLAKVQVELDLHFLSQEAKYCIGPDIFIFPLLYSDYFFAITTYMSMINKISNFTDV